VTVPSSALRLTGSRLALAEGAALVLVALYCLWFQLRLPSSHVAEADYVAFAQHLVAQKQPGDVVLLAPWWTERARLFVPGDVSVVGHLQSDQEDLSDAPRIFVLSQPNLPGAHLGTFWRAFLPQRRPLDEPRTFGNLVVQLFENNRFRLKRFDASGTLPTAAAYLQAPDGSKQPCQWQGERFRCGNGQEIAVEWHEVFFAPYRCLRLYPPGGALSATLEFANVPALTTVELRAAYTWDRGTFKEGVDSTFLELQDGTQTRAVELKPGQEHFVSTVLSAVPPGATLKVASRATSANAREVCVQLFGY
jgi:hypothetical protein